MEDIILVDDFVDLLTQESIKELCMSPHKFFWYYNNQATVINSVQNPFPVTKDSVETPMFSHVVANDNGDVNTPHFKEFVTIFNALPIKKILRCKINLTTMSQRTTPTSYGLPHTDYTVDFPFVTAIYYINDSDGDTIIFNETNEHKGELTIKHRITPKQGRMVMFSGDYLHSGNNPTTDIPRLTLNINFVPSRVIAQSHDTL